MSCQVEGCDCDIFTPSKLIARQFVGLCIRCQHCHTPEQAAQRDISNITRPCQVGSFAVFISDFSTATNAELLRKHGITHIVCCCPAAFDLTKGARRLGQESGIERLELDAFEDSSNQPLDVPLAAALPFIESALAASADNRVLVHCAQGVSRSCSIVMCWLIKQHAMTYDDALALIKETRPICNPNTSFERQLRAIEAQKVRQTAAVESTEQ
jgi:predicted protein tyrosine phosphatase